MKKASLGSFLLVIIMVAMFLSGGCVSQVKAASRPQFCTVVVPLDLKGNVSWSHECDLKHFQAIADAIEGDQRCDTDLDCGEY